MEPEPDVSGSAASLSTSGRFQTGVRTLIVLVGCCGLVSWAARSLWESQHPSIAAARRLRSGSASDRVAAIRELERVGPGESNIAIPALIAALRETDADICLEAAQALGPLVAEAFDTGSAGELVHAPIAALIQLMNDQRPALRLAAVKSLARVCSTKSTRPKTDLAPVVAGLVMALDDADDELRLEALRGLGLCGPQVSNDPPHALIAAIDDRSAKNRAAAVTALATFQRSLDPWIPSLIRRLEHDEAQVRRACGNALGRSRPPAASEVSVPVLIAALDSPVPEVRCYAALALSRLRSSALTAVHPLITSLKEPKSLEQGQPDNAPPRAAIGPLDGDPVVGAALALGQIAPGTTQAPNAVDALIEVVRSRQPSRRTSALFRALGEFGSLAAAVIPDLIKAIDKTTPTDDSPFFVGSSAATALGQIAPGTPLADEVIAVLTTALHSKSSTMRLAATNALRPFGPKAKSATPQLRVLLADPEYSIKKAAATALTAVESDG
jgi:HEAT repeat protein